MDRACALVAQLSIHTSIKRTEIHGQCTETTWNCKYNYIKDNLVVKSTLKILRVTMTTWGYPLRHGCYICCIQTSSLVTFNHDF